MDDTMSDATDPAAERPVPELGEALSAVEGRLAAIETAVGALSTQLALVPPQVRSLGARVDALTTSVAETRLRALFLELLAVYDLVDQAARARQGHDPDGAHQRTCEAIRTQLRQLLESHGLTEIPADGPFDPQLHRALQRIAVADAEHAGRILEVVRPGYRAGQSVLRYAEVTVGYLEAPTDAAGEAPAAN
jgi:molecular chaperone GrpE